MDLRATWVRLGVILGNPRVILELSWEDLGDTWVHIGCIFWNVGAILKKTWNLSCSTLGDIAHTKGECGFYAGFIDVFSTSAWVAEVSSCAMSGPSWGYLRRTWELFGSALGHIAPC